MVNQTNLYLTNLPATNSSFLCEKGLVQPSSCWLPFLFTVTTRWQYSPPNSQLALIEWVQKIIGFQWKDEIYIKYRIYPINMQIIWNSKWYISWSNKQQGLNVYCIGECWWSNVAILSKHLTFSLSVWFSFCDCISCLVTSVMFKPVAMLVKRTRSECIGSQWAVKRIKMRCRWIIHVVWLHYWVYAAEINTPPRNPCTSSESKYTLHAVPQESVISYNGILMRPQVGHLDLAVWDIEVGGNRGGRAGE